MKCARVTGDVMGKYHPHGDGADLRRAGAHGARTSRCATRWSHGHGNFGSPDDPPAAARYTECRLAAARHAHARRTSTRTPSTSTTTTPASSRSPTVLPARFPNLLVNGSQGIAVGMATNIPPHNLGEVIDATDAPASTNPEATPDDLMQFVKGPDFPTGAPDHGPRRASSTPTAPARARSACGPRPRSRRAPRGDQHRRHRAARTRSSPNAIARQDHRAGRRPGRSRASPTSTTSRPAARPASSSSSSSDAPGARHPQQPLQAHPAADELRGEHRGPGRRRAPHAQPARGAAWHYIDHQVEVITRRSRVPPATRPSDRAHIVEGLLKALDLIDADHRRHPGLGRQGRRPRRAAWRRRSSSPRSRPSTSSTCRCHRLTRLGRADLEEEMAQLRATIAELEAILGRRRRAPRRHQGRAGRDPREVRRRAPQPRSPTTSATSTSRTSSTTRTSSSPCRPRATSRPSPADAFRTQGRGGRGVAGAKLKRRGLRHPHHHTPPRTPTCCSSPTSGRVYRLKAHEIPMKDRTARGTAIVNLLPLQPGEQIQAIIDTRDYETNRFLFFATTQGPGEEDQVHRVRLVAAGRAHRHQPARRRRAGAGHPHQRRRRHLHGQPQPGMTIRFAEDDVRPMGRAAAGVRGMKMKPGRRGRVAATSPATTSPS